LKQDASRRARRGFDSESISLFTAQKDNQDWSLMSDEPAASGRSKLWIGVCGGSAVLAAILALVLVRGALAKRSLSERSDTVAASGGKSTGEFDRDPDAAIAAFCGDCHATPRPASFPRDAWHDEVQKGYQFYSKSGRADLKVPPIPWTVAYFRSRAPEKMSFPTPAEAGSPLRTSFRMERIPLNTDVDLQPAVANLLWTSLVAGQSEAMLVSDMRNGRIVSLNLREKKPVPRIVTRLQNPSRMQRCDLDGDGAMDLIVADLGSLSASDHDRGQVLWFRHRAGIEQYSPAVIASGLCRVADVRPGDFDGDGDPDVLVAEFGNYSTGKISLLKNAGGAPGNAPRFEQLTIDDRPGAIDAWPHDLDGDGRLDFVAVISQEYEQVVAYMNQGNLQFAARTLWSGPDLTFGSSGIELVDLDGDGDVDILYTNGDSFDNMYVNPSHGIQWLENTGKLQFAYHRLTDMLGAYRAVAGDVDLDGDLDILAVAWLPEQILPVEAAKMPKASIVCLEQTVSRVFVRHTLETDFPYYPTIATGDFDGDGDLDFAVGPQVANAPSVPRWLAVWWNESKPPAK
jgi:hypothetical protein